MKRLIASTVLGLLVSCSAVPATLTPPTVTFAGASDARFNLVQQQVVLHLDAFNPNAVGVGVENLQATLDVQGISLAHLSADAFRLEANSHTDVPIASVIPTLQLLAVAQKLKGGPDAAEWHLYGSAEVGPLRQTVNFDRHGHFKLPPELKVQVR